MAVTVHASAFAAPFAHANGVARLSVTHADLRHAIVRVGYKSRAKAISTVGLWRARLLENLAKGYITNHFLVTDFYRRLEQTEKAFASFILAEALTLLFAEQSLGMRHLLHLTTVPGFHWQSPLSQVTAKPGAANPADKSRPDFIGWDGMNYHIFESKGRIRRPSQNEIAKALGQSCRVVTVKGQTPLTRSAAFFVFHKDKITGIIQDPPGEIAGCSAEFDEFNMLKTAYTLFLDVTPSASPDLGDNFVSIDISDETSMGLDRRIYKALVDEPRSPDERRARVQEITSLMIDAYETNQGRRSQSLSISRSGTFVLDRRTRSTVIDLG